MTRYLARIAERALGAPAAGVLSPPVRSEAVMEPVAEVSPDLPVEPVVSDTVPPSRDRRGVADPAAKLAGPLAASVQPVARDDAMATRQQRQGAAVPGAPVVPTASQTGSGEAEAARQPTAPPEGPVVTRRPVALLLDPDTESNVSSDAPTAETKTDGGLPDVAALEPGREVAPDDGSTSRGAVPGLRSPVPPVVPRLAEPQPVTPVPEAARPATHQPDTVAPEVMPSAAPIAAMRLPEPETPRPRERTPDVVIDRIDIDLVPDTGTKAPVARRPRPPRVTRGSRGRGGSGFGQM